MVAAIFSRAVIVAAGILYPAYSSFKAVRARSHRDYTQWMMYWIVFAVFQAVEVVADMFLTWLPFYFEAKIVFVLWLVLPITQGSRQLYRVVIHPFLVRHETEIDETLQNFGEKGMQAVRTFTQQGVNLAANTVVTSAIKGQAVIAETLLQSQQQQQQQQLQVEEADGGETAIPAEPQEERQQRPHSSSSSSYFSEEYELIEPEEHFEDPPDEPPPPPTSTHYLTTSGEHPIKTDSNGLYHRS